MPKKSQVGFAAVPILVIALLVVGVGLGVYLVGQKTNLLPKAAEPHNLNAPNEADTNFYMQALINSEANSSNIPDLSSGGILLGTSSDSELKMVRPNAVVPGQKIYLPIKVVSEKEAANLFVASLKFSNETLQVEQIMTDQSIVSLWVEKVFKNDLGTISLIGGKPSPGYKSEANQKGLIAVVVFSAKKTGDASVAFGEETTMYSNADNRAMSKSTGSVSFKIVDRAEVPIISPTPVPVKIKGDANGDGKVDFSDLSILVSLLNQPASEHQELDFNNDGKLNSVDMGSLLKLLNSPK